MQEIRRKKTFAIGLRARIPMVVRVMALLLLVAGLIVVGISYYRLRNNKPFRMFGGQPELSTQEIGRVTGYERRITEGDRLRLLVRAALDVTFSDNHHEMEDVLLEVYPQTGDKPDRITAQRAIYVPDQTDPNQATITFTGNVNIETRDALIAKTDTIVYDQKSEQADSKSLVTFSRENVSGHATGAHIDAKNKRLDLRSNVEITIAPDVEKGSEAKPNPRARPVTMRAAQASFDQQTLHLTFTGGATAEQGSDIMSG
ncbi:MAG: LPS export ABC transporter periplasmic protein LptC, partial [Pyrinomonadaceae bacterium]|nr:LPS export ABC transporter periplasmic protein LptC [Pyrinomonadaceae bacterium]